MLPIPSLSFSSSASSSAKSDAANTVSGITFGSVSVGGPTSSSMSMWLLMGAGLLILFLIYGRK